MTFKTWCKEVWAGGFWSQSKLNSRKFLFACIFITATYIATFLFVKYSGITSSSIIENGVDAIRDVIIAYFAMNVVDAGINIYAKYKNGIKEQVDCAINTAINTENKPTDGEDN